MHYYGAYFAYFLSVPLSIMPFIPLYLLPETAKFKKDDSTIGEDPFADRNKALPTLRSRLHEMNKHIRKDLLPILKSVSILIGMFSMVVASFSLAIGDIIMQYMKARFGWDYERVGAGRPVCGLDYANLILGNTCDCVLRRPPDHLPLHCSARSAQVPNEPL